MGGKVMKAKCGEWTPGEGNENLSLRDAWMMPKGKQNALRGLYDCKCGGETEVWVAQVRCKRTVSCGCVKRAKAAERAGKLNCGHGMSKHPLYKQYKGMVARCRYPSQTHYKNYGGRGIKVCPEWESSFETFRDWAIENGWERGLTIERKNVNGDYEPSNCIFATMLEQANNKRTNRILAAFGESKTLAEWTRDSRCNAHYIAILNRLDLLGWDVEKAITTPVRKCSRI